VILGMEPLLRVYQTTQEDYSMFRRFTKKRAWVALTAVLALAITGAAVAYLTSTGGGTGSGNVTATSQSLSITFSQPALTHIGETQSVGIYATNSGTSPEYFSGLTAFSVGSADTTKCPTGSFTAATPTTTGQEIAADSAPHQVGTVSVTFNDLQAVQDGCVGNGTVAYSASSN
jgi:hypothetical protein